ncbi:MAG: glycosyltransferase [Campylobacterota bacterium]|nr:glycosyltransferase [Campylobacterota bacterium]
MKVAIVHDWLVTNAGAEKVLRSIVNLYPDADIFSLVDFMSDEERNIIIDGKKVHTSFIQKLPYAKKQFRNYLPLFPKAIESFNLSAYDLIISSSWAVAKGVKKTPDQLHICYCHTPIRYAWDLYDEYTKDLPWLKKIVVKNILKYIKKWDLGSIDRVDYFIANSKFVQARIKRIYNRESTVIYPPINIDAFRLNEHKEHFYFTASRLVPYKKTKLIVQAFNEMPDRELIVIGSGEELPNIQKIAKNNIKILGYQSDETLIATMQMAKAFVYAAIEDFGIIPIEAMSCGTPVIALDEGGTKETIIDQKTGVHFPKQTIASIIDAVQKFEQLDFNPREIHQEAMKYTHFEAELRAFITKGEV